MVKADAFGKAGIAKFHCIFLNHEFAVGSLLQSSLDSPLQIA